MVSGLTTSLAKKLFLKTLKHSSGSYLELVCPQESYRFGRPDDPLHAVLAVHDERFFRRAVLGRL